MSAALSVPVVLPPEFLPAIAELLRRHAVEPVPLEEWRRQVLAEWARKAPSTRYRVAQAVREAIALAGPGADTAALTPALVARLAARPGRSATVNGLLAGLRAAMRLAARRRSLAADVVGECAWHVADRDAPRVRHHPREAIARVLGHIEASSQVSWCGGRLHALACVLAYAGLRRNEALRLRVEDVDLPRRVLHVRANGGRLKTRSSCAPVPCPRTLVEVLAGWAPRCGSEWLFPYATKRGRPWLGGQYGTRPAERLRAAGLAVGVPGFTPHSLRHSLATHLIGHWGLSPAQVRLVLRHSTERTQAQYVHPDVLNLVGLVAGFDYGAPSRREG